MRLFLQLVDPADPERLPLHTQLYSRAHLSSFGRSLQQPVQLTACWAPFALQNQSSTADMSPCRTVVKDSNSAGWQTVVQVTVSVAWTWLCNLYAEEDSTQLLCSGQALQAKTYSLITPVVDRGPHGPIDVNRHCNWHLTRYNLHSSITNTFICAHRVPTTWAVTGMLITQHIKWQGHWFRWLCSCCRCTKSRLFGLIKTGMSIALLSFSRRLFWQILWQIWEKGRHSSRN